ncbi:MAG: dethiobiotin synthase [Actinobacteria bacterium]|nr:dethiobiotin synthase [Actinomycetota bacterium]
MGAGVFITGTDTGVGKTVVTAGLLAALRKSNIDVVAFKPVQSGALPGGSGLTSPDATFYLKASRIRGGVSDYSLYCFEQPFSPHLAAEMSGVEVSPKVIITRCRDLLARHQALLVEGAGGICVPLTRSGYTVADLAKDLGFPLVVVARPTLGTINHTVLTIKYSQSAGLKVAGFIFNSRQQTTDPPGKDNARVINAMTGAPMLGWLPHLPGLDMDRGIPGDLAEAAAQHLCWREIGGMVR